MERTAAAIQDLKAEWLKVWGQAHRNWDIWLQFYELAHQIEIVLPAKARRLPFFRSRLDAMVDTMVTSKPVVTREPVAPGKAHEAKADTKVEPWAQGLLERGAAVWGLVPPFRAAAKHLGLFGYAVLGCRWDEEAWPHKPRRGQRRYEEKLGEWEKKRGRAFPFVIEAPHPARVLLPHNERYPSMAIEVATMFAKDALQQYGVPVKNKATDLVEALIYWDREWVGVVVDGELVVSKPNIYKFVPWTHAYSGRGQEHSPVFGVKATESSLGVRPEDLAVGLLAGNEDLVRSLDEISSAGLHLLKAGITPNQYVLRGAAEIMKQKGSVGVGGIIELTDREVLETMRWEEPPRLPPETMVLMDFWRRAFEMGTVAGVVRGEREPGVGTATQHAMMLGAARMQFEMPLQQLNYMAEQLLGYCAQMVEVRGESVTVNGVTVRGGDFEGNYDFAVDFLAEDEAARLRKGADGREEKKMGLISNKRYWEQTGVSDAVGESREIWLDKQLDSPEMEALVREAVAVKIREKYGLPPPGAVPFALGQAGAGPRQAIPQPFMAQPGGPQETAQVLQGMQQVPGAGTVRAGA